MYLATYFNLIRNIKLLKKTFLILLSLAGNVYAVTCTPVTSGESASITANCDGLVIRAAEAVQIENGVTVSDANAPPSYHSVNIATGSTNSFSNYGSVTQVIGIGNVWNAGTLGLLANYGSMTAEGSNTNNILNSGTITSLINSGSLSDQGGSSASGIYNYGSGSSIGSLINLGTITVGDSANMGIRNQGVITTLNNLGTVEAGHEGYAIHNSGTIGSISNSGNLLAGGDAIVLYNAGTINSILNTGAMRGTFFSAIYNIGNIGTLTNYGVISNSNDVYNGGAIGSINNLQNGLTFSGALPTNYRIIFSASDYGSLVVSSGTGITNFGIYSGSPKLPAYTNVLENLPTSNIGATRTGTYQGLAWSLVAGAGSNNWDLTFSGTNTSAMAALNQTTTALQNAFTLQNTVLVNGFTYDCPVFDKNNVCVSVGGRYTTANSESVNSTGGLLIGAYRMSNQVRLGSYIDQNVSTNSTGIVKVGNASPMVGIFGVWTDRLDGTGAELKVSAGYGQKNATMTRPVVDGTEAGSGSSTLTSQGIQAIGKYGFAIADKTTVSPYVGLRYSQNNMGGYTEGSSASVTAPLTYGALNTNATTVVAGFGANYKLMPYIALLASAGLENDLNTSNGNYTATGLYGLNSINFNASPVRTRATGTLGAYYDLAKNQRLSITGIYRQEAYQATATTTVMATYAVGL